MKRITPSQLTELRLVLVNHVIDLNDRLQEEAHYPADQRELRRRLKAAERVRVICAQHFYADPPADEAPDETH